jgi:hypothetical protein
MYAFMYVYITCRPNIYALLRIAIHQDEVAP